MVDMHEFRSSEIDRIRQELAVLSSEARQYAAIELAFFIEVAAEAAFDAIEIYEREATDYELSE